MNVTLLHPGPAHLFVEVVIVVMAVTCSESVVVVMAFTCLVVAVMVYTGSYSSS